MFRIAKCVKRLPNRLVLAPPSLILAPSTFRLTRPFVQHFSVRSQTRRARWKKVQTKKNGNVAKQALWENFGDIMTIVVTILTYICIISCVFGILSNIYGVIRNIM